MIDRATLTLLQNRMAQKLKELEDELGVRIDQHGGQYGNADGSAVAKFRILKVAKATPGQPATDPRKEAFAVYANLFGFEPSDFGRLLVFRGTQYRLVGFNPGSPKNACAIERVSDRKEFKASPELVRGGFFVSGKSAA